MQAFIHILVVENLAMLVSYNLDILYFNQQTSLCVNSWFATFRKRLTEYYVYKLAKNFIICVSVQKVPVARLAKPPKTQFTFRK
jgi:hypothetical protein